MACKRGGMTCNREVNYGKRENYRAEKVIGAL